jgi:CRP-like cAMP-binding protein
LSSGNEGGSAARGPLSRAELGALVAGGHEQKTAGGGYLFRSGELLDHVYIIRQGLAALGRDGGTRRVVLLLFHAGDIVVLLLFHAGDIAGDVPLLAGVPALVDAVAVTDTVFVTIPAPVFLASLEHSPGFAKRWALSLGGRLAASKGSWPVTSGPRWRSCCSTRPPPRPPSTSPRS